VTGLALVRLFLERLRTERASTLALAAFVLATAFLFGLGPRLLAATADDVLRTTVGANPVADRNVAFDEQTRIRAGAADDPFEAVEEEGDALQAQLPDALATSFVDRVASADSTRWSVVSATGAGTIVTIRFEPRAFDRLRLVAGRWPGASDRTVVVPGTGTDPELRAPVYEAALVEASATKIGVHVGDLVLLRPDRRDPQAASLPMAAAVEVVGTYAPSDPADPFWYGEAALLRPTIRAISNEVQFTDVFALAAPAAYPRYVEATSDLGAPLRYRWRVQLDPARLDAATVGRVEAGLRRLETSLPASAYATGGAVVSSRLVDILGGEEAQWRSALAVLVVMATGPVAIAVAAFGLVALLGAGRFGLGIGGIWN